MNNAEIAKLIQEKYRYVDCPTEKEVEAILAYVKIRQLVKPISESELGDIINSKVSKTKRYVFDSVDTSATISILQQIIDSSKK